MADFRRPKSYAIAAGVSLFALTACTDGFDLDFRGAGGGFDTTEAALKATAARPRADDRGIISYPNFQVALAERGDTVIDVANRIGVEPGELARYNGIAPNAPLRKGEVIALPTRVAEPSAVTGAAAVGPVKPVDSIDVTTLASNALDRVDQTTPAAPAATAPARPAVQAGPEPIRHKVARGETAYSISRLYGVSVRSLGDWNGLGPRLTVREGQFLLIPVAAATAPSRPDPAPEATPPGTGSPTPTPPSASQPLPAEDASAAAAAPPPSPNLAEDRTAASSTRLLLPVSGSIIRPYEKRKNDGIDISASAGTAVKAAADGTVAAITRDTDQVPIMVLRHADNLLTVYANIDGITVKKGDTITRGQTIAKVRDSSPSFLHFEVREGFESVDPVPFVN